MEYRVLARKYRPASFADLIGQEALVRTLSNAIKSGRIHHAFVLTGIRGVGKTTTARIIARALNCEQGPTVEPCGVCASCVAIAGDRHMDVLEMDAASRTGVGDIRDLIDTVQYAPVSSRYKIYIIDEVHMLSTSAFNALLKTLEEPPPHVKFIFATTEARKIPVTILSRCQRFDLKRVEQEALAAHLSAIAAKEGAAVSPEALAVIAQAAEGSVRDGLSLLDQAIAHDAKGEAELRAMLGLADRAQTLILLRALVKGEAGKAMAHLRELYHAGADPQLVLQDMMEMAHFITRIQLAPQAANDVAFAEHERKGASELAAQLSMPVLARLWQMLLKAASEARVAPSPLAAVEMALVRIAYASTLPTPAEALKGLAAQPAPVPALVAEKKTSDVGLIRDSRIADREEMHIANHESRITTFEEAIAALEAAKEPLLASQLKQFGSVVAFEPGDLKLHMQCPVGREFTAKVAQALAGASGQEWKVTLADAPGAPTLRERETERKQQEMQRAAGHPLVKSVMEHFPGAELIDVKEAI